MQTETRHKELFYTGLYTVYCLVVNWLTKYPISSDVWRGSNNFVINSNWQRSPIYSRSRQYHPYSLLSIGLCHNTELWLAGATGGCTQLTLRQWGSARGSGARVSGAHTTHPPGHNTSGALWPGAGGQYMVTCEAHPMSDLTIMPDVRTPSLWCILRL